MASTEKPEGWMESVKTVVYALLIAGVFRTLFFQPFWIPTESMKSTLLIGDFIFVNKMAYGYSAVSCPFSICPISGRIWEAIPERGDVVVFRHPHNSNDLIKRLVGLPGDQIQIKAGALYINGAMVPQVAGPDFQEINEPQGPIGSIPGCANAPVARGEICKKSATVETLPNGFSHAVLNIMDNGPADNTGVFTVPEGNYFVMGDNRDNSLDSRFSAAAGGVGFLPAENLIGRADRIMFSSAGRSMFAFWTWRLDRFFYPVQ